jgi:hypothetical protein
MAKDEPGTFSLRYGLRPRPAGLLYDSVPNTARVGLLHIVQDYGAGDYEPDVDVIDLYREATRALRVKRDSGACDWEGGAWTELERIVSTCEWWAFYDLCELITDHLERALGASDQFQADANRLFDEECLGWRLKGGLVERVGTQESQRLLDEARESLKDARFAGPEEQFAKAVRALSLRPQPDTANCVKDAVGALEGVARIVTGRPSALLSKIVAELSRKKILHPALAKCFDGLYAYRGDAGGAAHGAVTAEPVPVAEAEMALNTSAALIIYLVEKDAEVGLSS